MIDKKYKCDGIETILLFLMMASTVASATSSTLSSGILWFKKNKRKGKTYVNSGVVSTIQVNLIKTKRKQTILLRINMNITWNI